MTTRKKRSMDRCAWAAYCSGRAHARYIDCATCTVSGAMRYGVAGAIASVRSRLQSAFDAT